MKKLDILLFTNGRKRYFRVLNHAVRLIMRHKLFLLCVLAAIVHFVFPSGRGQAADPDELVLGIHPYLPAVELHKRFIPLVHYLEGKTGKKIRIEIANCYDDHVRKVGENRSDFAFMGPAPYIAMTEKYGQKIILAGLEVNGSPTFHGVIVVGKDSPFVSLADLAGKKMAFTDLNSTMGYIVPMSMLEQAGVTKDKLAQSSFVGSHNNVAMVVLGGYFDAGAVKEDVYTEFKERGLRMLAKSPPIPDHLFVASSKLSPQLAEILRTSLLGLKDAPGGLAIMESIQKHTMAFVSVKDGDFDELRKIMSSSAEKSR